ncbi:hypothetical protein KC333_g194 [Hortaea werneckii]|nr:hypothetical protein KC333_g194 [Hortaea werneckii]
MEVLRRVLGSGSEVPAIGKDVSSQTKGRQFIQIFSASTSHVSAERRDFLFETGIILVVPAVEDLTEVEAESAKTLR